MSGPPGARVRKVLMSAAQLGRCLARLAEAIRRSSPRLEGSVLVGVQTRGVPIAERLCALLELRSGVRVPVGSLDITLYRDDLTTIAEQPVIKGTHIPVSIDGRNVILVDDVLYTGRTARAALDELIDFGRPARIQLCVLVDRGHRELPIHGDFVGLRTKTALDEIVQVMLREEDGQDEVRLLARGDAPPKAAVVRKARSGKRR